MCETERIDDRCKFKILFEIEEKKVCNKRGFEIMYCTCKIICHVSLLNSKLNCDYYEKFGLKPNRR